MTSCQALIGIWMRHSRAEKARTAPLAGSRTRARKARPRPLTVRVRARVRKALAMEPALLRSRAVIPAGPLTERARRNAVRNLTAALNTAAVLKGAAQRTEPARRKPVRKGAAPLMAAARLRTRAQTPAPCRAERSSRPARLRGRERVVEPSRMRPTPSPSGAKIARAGCGTKPKNLENPNHQTEPGRHPGSFSLVFPVCLS